MNNINNAVMAETGLDQYSAQQRKELLTQIAGFAASSSNKSKSGGGYMGLVKKAGGGMMPIKFLTRYKERGAHYDRTIVENCLNEDNKVFFTASETLERILLDLAAKAGDAAKKEVQDMLSDWRTKSGCGGKTLLSRNVVFKAVKAINNELKDEDKADLAHLKTEGSWGDTSLSTIRQRLSGQMNKGDTDKLRKALKTAHAKSTKVVDAMAKTKSTINGLKDAKFGGDLTEGERELLRKIRSAETLPKDDTKAGHGYMGLTISDGALVPLRFLTHYSERGAHTDRTIMANVADKGKVGELAFKSSKLLETVLLKLATRVGCGKDVSELFNDWKAKSQHNDQTLLSREVVHQVYAKINYALFAQNKPAVTADSLPEKSDTRVEQLNSLDAEQDLQTLDDMLNGNKPVNNAGNDENVGNIININNIENSDPDISVFKIDVDTVGGTPLLNGYQSGLTNDELDFLVRLEKSGQFKDLFDLFKIPASVNGSPTSIVTIADKLDKCLGGGGRLGDLFSKYAAKLTPAEALELVMATLHGTAVMNIPEDVEPEGVTEELAKKLKKITCDHLLGLNENKVAPIKDMHDESKLVFNPVNKSADNNIVNIEDGENQNEVLDTPESKSLWRQYLSQNQSFERLTAADQKNVLTMLTLIDGSRKQLAGAGATFLNNQLYDAFMAAMIIDALPKARQLQESRGNSNGVISYEDWCEALGLHPEEGGANFEVVYDVQDSDEKTKRIVEKLSPVNIAVALLNRSLTDLFGTPWLEVQSKAERNKYGEFLASFSAGGTYSENLEKFDTVAKSGMTHE